MTGERLHGIARTRKRQRWNIGTHEADPLVAPSKEALEGVMHPCSEIVALLVEQGDAVARFHDPEKDIGARWRAGEEAINWKFKLADGSLGAFERIEHEAPVERRRLVLG